MPPASSRGARPCHDLTTLRATGRLLHAHLAATVSQRPAAIAGRDDRWARAERVAFGAAPPDQVLPSAVRALVLELTSELQATQQEGTDLGPDQLVHGDLAGNVLLDATGRPLVIDVAPYWRPALWAEAVCVLDAVLWLGADPQVMSEWSGGARRQAMLRAGLFRVLSDERCDVAAYRRVLGVRPAPGDHAAYSRYLFGDCRWWG